MFARITFDVKSCQLFQQVATNDKFATGFILTDLLQLDEINKYVAFKLINKYPLVGMNSFFHYYKKVL